MISSRGIYYDLNESTYILKYNDIELYFSSKFYMNKFKSEIDSYIRNESFKLKAKYKCNIEASILFIISLYMKIESRGFKIKYKEKNIKNINLIVEFLER